MSGAATVAETEASRSLVAGLPLAEANLATAAAECAPSTAQSLQENNGPCARS